MFWFLRLCWDQRKHLTLLGMRVSDYGVRVQSPAGSLQHRSGRIRADSWSAVECQVPEGQAITGKIISISRMDRSSSMRRK